MKTKTILELLTLSSSIYFFAKDSQFLDKISKLSEKSKDNINRIMSESQFDENGNELEFVDKIKVKDIMTQKPFYLTTKSTIEDVSKVLAKGNYHAVPVLENDKIVGIVSTADLIKYFLNNAL